MKTLSLAIIFVMASLTSVRSIEGYWVSHSVDSRTTIQVGQWAYANVWEPDESYTVGDVVFWEGVYWVRTKQAGGSNIEPGSPAGWVFWDEEA